jgi:hypothetical protein
MIRMRARLLVLHVLVLTLLVVLAMRLWQVQVVRGQEFVTRATETRTRTVIVPAVRGQILDSSGRPLVRNKTALVVSVDRTRLSRMPDSGVEVLRKLSAVLDRSVAQLQQRITPCGPGIAKPCWTGSPYQPVPLDEKVDTREALQILERQEEFPGVTAEIHSVRQHPGGRAGAQMLGYLQPVTEAELEKREGLKASFSGVDLVGRDGLEYVYDEALRGKAGLRRVQVDRMGKALGVEEQTTPIPGDHLVTSIDSRVQNVVEKALARAMKSAPAADGGAGVVLDAQRPRLRSGDLGGRDLSPRIPVADVGEVRQAARVAGDQRPVRAGFDVQGLVGDLHAAGRLPAQRQIQLPRLRHGGRTGVQQLPRHPPGHARPAHGAGQIVRHDLLPGRVRAVLERRRPQPEEDAEGGVRQRGEGLRLRPADGHRPAGGVVGAHPRPGLEEGPVEPHQRGQLRAVA